MAYGNGGAIVGTAYQGEAAIPKAPQQPRAGDRIERNENALEALDVMITQLIDRLEPVLTPIPPQTAGGRDSAPTPMASGLVSALRGHGLRIEASIQRLAELSQRIEL